MSTPALKRGAAYLADDGTIKVFCDGGYRTCTVDDAIGLRDQITAAILEARPEPCGWCRGTGLAHDPMDNSFYDCPCKEPKA